MSWQQRIDSALPFAEEMARDAAAVANRLFRQTSARRKQDGTLITEADEAANQLIETRIRERFPDHTILSEEAATIYDPDVNYTWVIDPIDGTTNFARGLSVWGVSIGLLERGRPLLGALSFPRLDEHYSAAAGRGATCNGDPLKVDVEAPLGEQEIFTLCTRSRTRFEITTPLKARMLGSAAYHLLAVATGASRAALEGTPKVWDMAAAYLVVHEAGGTIAHLEGDPIFPLNPEKMDYARISRPVLAASSPELFRTMQDCIKPIA